MSASSSEAVGAENLRARAVVLAAGAAERLGRPKSLLLWRRRPLLEHVLAAVGRSALDGGVLVLGHAARDIRRAVTVPSGMGIVLNPDHARGQATSLQRGVARLDDATGAAVVLLADQPTVQAVVIDAVVAAWRDGAGPVVRAGYRDRPGHPVLLDRSVWPALAELDGDHGARPLLVRHPDLAVDVPVDADAPPDIDTWADYQALIGR